MTTVNRRDFCFGAAAAVSALAAQAGQSAPAGPSRSQRLSAAMAASRMAVDFDGSRFSGAGYDWLLRRGGEAQAFLVGEEHGIAENPKLAGQLFTALAPRGYRRLAIEISPPMASALDQALLRGPEATRAFVTTPESFVAFYGMKEEAEFLATARKAMPQGRPLLWGLDYELGGDRFLITQLRAAKKPAAAAAPLKTLADASAASWAQYARTKNPQFIYSFVGDPALVRALKAAWPSADPQSRIIMDTLEHTFTINAAWVAGKGYESNLIRSRFLRANLLRYWKQLRPGERVFMKFGASHMVRGVNMSDTFDIGTLIPELAALRGGTSFSMLVLPGPGSQTANLDPTTFKYVPGNRDQYGEGMELFDAAVLPGKFTLFDTAPLRPIASSTAKDVPLPLWRVVHGFDAVLVMTGSRPSSNL